MKPDRAREIRELVTKAGLAVVEMEMTRGQHLRALVRRSDGAQAKVIFPNTPSDYRGRLNKLAELRRFARGDAEFIRRREHE